MPQVHSEPWTEHSSLLGIWQSPLPPTRPGVGLRERWKEGDLVDEHRHAYSTWWGPRTDCGRGGLRPGDQLVSFLQPMSREQSCPEALTLYQGCPSLLSLCSHHITFILNEVHSGVKTGPINKTAGVNQDCLGNQGRLPGELLQPRAWRELGNGSGSPCQENFLHVTLCPAALAPSASPTALIN